MINNEGFRLARSAIFSPFVIFNSNQLKLGGDAFIERNLLKKHNYPN